MADRFEDVTFELLLEDVNAEAEFAKTHEGDAGAIEAFDRSSWALSAFLTAARVPGGSEGDGS